MKDLDNKIEKIYEKVRKKYQFSLDFRQLTYGYNCSKYNKNILKEFYKEIYNQGIKDSNKANDILINKIIKAQTKLEKVVDELTFK